MSEPAVPSQPPAAARLVLDTASQQAWLDGHPLALGQGALAVLYALATAPGRVVPAATLMAAAWPGQARHAGALRMLVARLRQQLGAGALLNVPGRGYSLALAAAVTPTPQPVAWPGALPAWDEVLIGRDQDIAAANTLLERHRLVNLLGAGGIGKTRLAHALAVARRAGYRDGCWWVDLSTVPSAAVGLGDLAPQDIANVARAIADAMALQTPALTDATAASTLARHLAPRHCLLVLDNAEHLVLAVDTVVQALLDHAPQLQLLLTSQVALQRPDEWLYRLDTLAVPAPGDSPDAVRGSPSVQLLLRRAQALQPGFALADADVADAADLVRRLDGIALAIELAAARLPSQGWAAVLAAVLARLPPGATQPGAVAGACAARHHTLHAALQWSLGLLSYPERQALCTLSVFAGSFSLAGAVHLLADALPDRGRRLAVVQRLVDASLLQVVHQGDRGGHLRLLETTRQHARGLLVASGRLDTAVQRHTQTMAWLAEQSLQAFDTASDTALRQTWLPWHQDWIQAFDHAAAAGDASAAAPISEALTQIGYLNGRFSVIRARAATALALADQATGLPRAWLLNRAVQATHAGRSRLDAAQARVAAWRAVGAGPGLCAALAFLASCLQHAGDPAGADAALAECDAGVRPEWPARVRYRCGPTLRFDIGAARGDPAMMLRDLDIVDALARAGAWRMALMHGSDVSLALRLQGRHAAAASRLQDLIASFKLLGCDADASRHAGMLSATLVAWADEPGMPRRRVLALHRQACLHAVQALQQQDPDDLSSLRYYLEPLAWLICQLGAPALAVTLLARGDRMRREIQYGCHALNAHAARQVRVRTLHLLNPAALAAAQADGEHLQGRVLHLRVLHGLQAWLQPGRQATAARHGPHRHDSGAARHADTAALLAMHA